MLIDESDRIFARMIADVTTDYIPNSGDNRLEWLTQLAAHGASSAQCDELQRNLCSVLAPVLIGAERPDDDIRRRSAEVYLNWLARV